MTSTLVDGTADKIREVVGISKYKLGTHCGQGCADVKYGDSRGKKMQGKKAFSSEKQPKG